MQYVFMVLLFCTALFLIMIVLVQRGKGGGLAGAFGGLGGQSAFGTKAGDTFTKITIVVAALWIVLCIASVKMLGTTQNVMNLGGPNSGLMPNEAPASGETPAPGTSSATPGEAAPATAPATESGSQPGGAAPASQGGTPAEKPAE